MSKPERAGMSWPRPRRPCSKSISRQVEVSVHDDHAAAEVEGHLPPANTATGLKE